MERYGVGRERAVKELKRADFLIKGDPEATGRKKDSYVYTSPFELNRCYIKRCPVCIYRIDKRMVRGVGKGRFLSEVASGRGMMMLTTEFGRASFVNQRRDQSGRRLKKNCVKICTTFKEYDIISRSALRSRAKILYLPFIAAINNSYKCCKSSA